MHRATLATIGRSGTVETDSPPSENENDFNDSGGQYFQYEAVQDSISKAAEPLDSETENSTPVFEHIDSDTLRSMLNNAQQKFSFLPCHRVAILRSHVDSISCLHSVASARLGYLLSCLQAAERDFMVLELRRKAIGKLHDLAVLVAQIERQKAAEFFQLEDQRRLGEQTSLVSQLECLYALCEGLRLHLSQQDVLRAHVQQNDVLQSILFRVRPFVNHVWIAHHQLFARALLLTHDFIGAGLRALAHTDLNRYTREDLWQIARGIEEFNLLLEQFRSDSRRRLLNRLCAPTSYGSPLFLVDGLKTVSFSKVLMTLARERALWPALSVREFYFENGQLVKYLTHYKIDASLCSLFFVENDKEEELQSSSCATAAIANAFGGVSGSGSSGLLTCTNRFYERFVGRLLKAGSPVNEYLRKEYDFASGFLDIVSQSTRMLHDLQALQRGRAPRLRKEETMEAICSSLTVPRLSTMMSPNAPLAMADESSVGRKKGVKWSDDAEVSLRHQIVGRYLEFVWNEVNRQFPLLCATHTWGDGEAAQNDLGSALLLQPGTKVLLSQIMRHTISKDLFPVGLLPMLYNQCLLSHMEAAVSLWDDNMCRALGTIDQPNNLFPTLMDGKQYCSRTCKSFMDALLPICSALSVAVFEVNAAVGQQRGLAQESADIPLHWTASCLICLHETVNAASQYTEKAARIQLATCNLDRLAFLLATDWVLLCSTITDGLAIVQQLVPGAAFCSAVAWSYMQREITFITNLLQSLQNKRVTWQRVYTEQCFAKARLLLSTYFPSSNKSLWRGGVVPEDASSYVLYCNSNGNQEHLSTVNSYVGNLLDGLLTPIACGLSMLPDAAQVNGLSPPMTALASAWTEHILYHRVKFSYTGACLLETDVNQLERWMTENLDALSVRNSLMSLDALRELQAGVYLLKCQPQVVSQSRSCSSIKCVSEVITLHPVAPLLNPEIESLTKEENAELANRDDWLALRLHPYESRKFLSICR